MTYFMAAGVVLWVLFRRIMFKVWWAVAVFAFTLPVSAEHGDNLTTTAGINVPYVNIQIAYWEDYNQVALGGIWGSWNNKLGYMNLVMNGNEGIFYLSTDPASTWTYAMKHVIVVNRIPGNFLRVDIHGQLISLTTYTFLGEFGKPGQHHATDLGDRWGSSATPAAFSDNYQYRDGIHTSRALEGVFTERELAADNGGGYWLNELAIGWALINTLKVVDESTIPDLTTGYTPDPTPDTTQSDMFDDISELLDDSDMVPLDDSEDFRDDILHADLVPEFSLPADVDALKVCIAAAFSSLLGNAAWEYDSPTYSGVAYDFSSNASTLFGEGDMYPLITFAVVDAVEVAHVEWYPWFSALRAFLTLCFTISVLFMIVRLTFWCFSISNPFGSSGANEPSSSSSPPEFGSSYSE